MQCNSSNHLLYAPIIVNFENVTTYYALNLREVIFAVIRNQSFVNAKHFRDYVYRLKSGHYVFVNKIRQINKSGVDLVQIIYSSEGICCAAILIMYCVSSVNKILPWSWDWCVVTVRHYSSVLWDLNNPSVVYQIYVINSQFGRHGNVPWKLK